MFTKKIIILILFGYIYLLAGQNNTVNYSGIDKHADSAPGHLKNSIPALVNYLVRPAQNDFEKVRAIFRWISQNIDYDVDSFFERRLINEDPETVIRRGSAVCGGYAQLFKRMCREIAIPCEIIPGWSKIYVETLSSQPNHAWNAVRINQQWYLLDVTWGSGYINDQQTYTKSFQEHYFLTDPSLMIYDHFPEDKKWQMLDSPITRQEFDNLILLRPDFFRTQLQLLSHKESLINVSDELVIKIAAPPTTYINAELIKDNQIQSDHFVFSQRLDNEYSIHVHFPDEGEYVLRVYTKSGNQQKLYHWACDYNIHVTKNVKANLFAKAFASFYDLDCFIYYPMDHFIDSDKVQPFKIMVPQALEVTLLINEKNVVPLKKDNTIYTASIKPDKGPLRIMAKTDTGNQYQFLLEYQVK